MSAMVQRKKQEKEKMDEKQNKENISTFVTEKREIWQWQVRCCTRERERECEPTHSVPFNLEWSKAHCQKMACFLLCFSAVVCCVTHLR